MIWIHISEALRIFSRRIRVAFKGFNQYSGDDEQICSQIINDCFNKQKNYYMVSNGHFTLFYARDFGLSVEALLALGYKKQVLSTLDYVLGVYKKHGKITESISHDGKPFTFPFNRYCPDALAFIIRSLRLAESKNLVNKYKSFLNQEIKNYFDIVVDEDTGLVKKGVHFSSMKDYSIRSSSCYDNVMSGMLADDLKYFKKQGLLLINPFSKFNYKKLLMDNFWNGKYFIDDCLELDIISGDANVLPFWSGLITDKNVFGKALASIKKEGLDRPFPLKYTSRKFKEHKMIYSEFLVGNYERDAVWAHVGMMYLKVVAKFDKKLAKKYLDEYKKEIDKHKNFLEVYDRDGRPFTTLLYHTDEGMLWCANYLYLKKLLK